MEARTRPFINTALVERLIAAQFPQWADLAVRPVPESGWDNRTFRLGAEMLVRLPSAAWYAPQVEAEHGWLPVLGPGLPLPIPQPLARGEPGEGYPWPWTVARWIEGETAMSAGVGGDAAFGADLARFLSALQGLDAAEGPAPGVRNFHRGGDLATYDGETRAAIGRLDGRFDAAAATAVWEAALAARFEGPAVWVHGDVAPGNLLVRDGRLCAVIDFGGMAVGDPACDLAVAWAFLEGGARSAFRAGLPLDAGTWARGRGWALWKALILATGLAQAKAEEVARAGATLPVVVSEPLDLT
ncbi:aminoglycoside phosphotransferase family protein [Caulobacter sp. NIBR1757]|uniref:aminoglycoside phosphotransferase family protein n=1 Tax=Caulobacter sp. NIBR1757 TaxID=3016000 RepID=UPI0022F0E4EA|nr:aminoglycoside phosphotransferase family protein [Caulobacter sp. NIBR1757]WGM39466.1 hypothetical protein AMEJIAPC_02386 [Caulobacter sp. NIBR1757]